MNLEILETSKPKLISRKKGALPPNVGKPPTEGVGNTKQPPAPKKQCTQIKNWFFTWNNYESNSIEILETKFNVICDKYIFEKEIGTNNKVPHLQGCIILKKKGRWSEFGLPNVIHWQPTKNAEKAALYCCKDYLSKITDNIYQKGYTELINKKKRPSDKEIFLMTNSFCRTTYVEFLIELVTNPFDFMSRSEHNRKIFWFWSHRGNVGKSTLIAYLALFHGVESLTGGNSKDIMNLVVNTKKEQSDNIWNTYIINIPRNQKNIAWSGMEAIKDGNMSNMKSHTNKTVILPCRPIVIVFANIPPPRGAGVMSDDRWCEFQIDWIDEIKNFDKRSLRTPP